MKEPHALEVWTPTKAAEVRAQERRAVIEEIDEMIRAHALREHHAYCRDCRTLFDVRKRMQARVK